ncbi:hypothetical protein CHUAL_005431 [Chamberlinius hualienensis]
MTLDSKEDHAGSVRSRSSELAKHLESQPYSISMDNNNSKDLHKQSLNLSKLDFVDGDTSSRDEDGLGVGTAAFFILGEIAGSGVVALPFALVGTGWVGIILMVAFCFMAGYSGILLGKCWIMMEERYEECRQVQRKPYQLMGIKCFGNWLSVVITVCIQVNLLGACVVYSLLISGMLQDLFIDLWPQSICYWDMIVVAIFIPLTWFGTPKDFWPLAVVAAGTIIIAALLTTVQSIIDSTTRVTEVHYPLPDFKHFSLAFGTILFAFGGAVTFPTFQNDMKHRSEFPKAASIGFAGTLLVYLPVACSGYFVYGYMTESNITMNLSSVPVRITVQSCMILHLFCAAVLLANPCFQNLEENLKIKQGFSIWKILFRTLMAFLILFVGETVPKFSVILDLLGGSINPILCFILPILFYMRLISKQSSPEFQHLNLKKRKIPRHEWIMLWEFIIISTLGGIAATVSAIDELIQPDALSKPCYVALAPVPT